MTCMCGSSLTEKVYRPYRDAANAIQWGWFDDCQNCHAPKRARGKLMITEATTHPIPILGTAKLHPGRHGRPQ